VVMVGAFLVFLSFCVK
jgi:hypothetical protein